MYVAFKGTEKCVETEDFAYMPWKLHIKYKPQIEQAKKQPSFTEHAREIWKKK